jgi:hypothetical protein
VVHVARVQALALIAAPLTLGFVWTQIVKALGESESGSLSSQQIVKRIYPADLASSVVKAGERCAVST